MILNESECEAEYKATLDRVAKVALVQYGFIATLLYVLLTTHTSYNHFLGLEIPRLAWNFVGATSLIALNVYLARNLRYLTKLLKMHPKCCRKLRFLTCHHSWVLNPFGTWTLKHPSAVTTANICYSGLLTLGWFASIFILDGDKNFHSLPRNQYWTISIVAMVLMLSHDFSNRMLHSSIERHRRTLFPNYYKREARRERALNNNDLSIIARPAVQ